MTALLTIASQVQADLSSTVPPAQNFDMSHWKLTLPVDRNGGVTGEAMEMSSSQLATMPGYSAKWFKTASNGGLSMEAAINGATTSGSSYPRSELREQMVTGSDSANWYASGNAVLEAQLTINNVPSTTGKIVVGQIHGVDAAPLVKLRYVWTASGGGKLDALVKATPSSTTDVSYRLSSNLPLKERFEYRISVSRGVMTMSVNKEPPMQHVISSQWASVGLYFKAGVYVQADGTSSTDISRVTFYRLAASHPENGLTVVTKSLAKAARGGYYTQVLGSSGGAGSVRWSLASGQLPAGLKLDANSGVISGYVSPTVPTTRDAIILFQVRDTTGANAVKALRIDLM
eukprot:TRINITY_DN3239_c0_g1_i4.p1 TRINITY_DN3239_c0_g1~~TRINITY_DN3239_c0_g1_i4.p1  ORF type:complete len:345 (+),score=96.26 TRINITY_DN3239_c0_g1_i4:175-1209(+)